MGSPPSWPFMDFNNPLPCFLQEDPNAHNLASLASPSHSPSPSLSPSQLLSSQASLGASTAKVSKRKSRAVSKPPIRVLSADRESFRDMVQKLTGIPTSPRTLQAGRLWGLGSNNSTAVFRSMAARQVDFSAYESAAIASPSMMPTLDTSSAYLTRGFPNNSNLMYSEVGNSRLKYQAVFQNQAGMEGAVQGQAMAQASPCADQGSNPATDSGIADIESFLLGNTKLEDFLQSKMDPWLTPHVEIAHSA